MIGEARFVLLGEASHGTHEFYAARAEITRRLIREKGFLAVAVEADWPDAYRVNRYVRGQSDDAESVEALDGFRRFPQWMWRNADVVDFVGWLREHNEAAGPAKAGFYGLDLYSLRASMAAVLEYLHAVDPEAALDRVAQIEPTLQQQLGRDRGACRIGDAVRLDRRLGAQTVEVDHRLVVHRHDLRVVAVAAVHVFETQPIGRLRRVIAGEQYRVGAALSAFVPAQEIAVAEAVLPGQVRVP